MKSFLVLALFVACAAADLAPGLRVKFNIGLRPGTDFFFDVPRTTAQAVTAKWSLTPRAPGPRASLSLYCYSDYTVCVYFDDTGNAAGFQAALDRDQFSGNIYDMKVTGFYEWEVNVGGTVKKFWAIALYFVSDEYLRLPVSERNANFNSSKLLQEDALWITGINGVIDKVPVEDSAIQNSIFTRQACIPWMGRHYYHNMRKDTECRAETMYPWFPLTDSGKLMGIGLMVMGKMTIKSGARDWFEHPPRLAISMIVPQGPECLYDMANNPGVTTMHVYLINRPWTIGCPIFGK